MRYYSCANQSTADFVLAVRRSGITFEGELRMLRTIVAFFGIAMVSVGYLPGAQQETQSPGTSSVVAANQTAPIQAASNQPASAHRALLNRYCVTCHNE